MALNRGIIRTEMRCQRKDVSRGSPNSVAEPPPTAFRKSNAEEWVAPWVSNVKGWKMLVAGRSAYLDIFLFAAASAVPPADWDDKWTYESARVLTTVTPQVSGLPACHGIRVHPGACRQFLSLVRLHGSLVTGTPAAIKDLAITSLIG